MADFLWRRLPRSTFDAMQGKAAPGGKGGGQRHIELGVNTARNDVASFLGRQVGSVVQMPTAAGPYWAESQLTIRPNAARNGSPWRIADQKSHRHPAWSDAAGFPSQYDSLDPPVVFLIKREGIYHAAWLPQKTFAALAPGLAQQDRGVDIAPKELLARFYLQDQTALAEFRDAEAAEPDVVFDPADQEDARKRTFAEMVRRQGQAAFRKELMKAYGGRCSVTGCAVLWVLEAAHISPYRGMDTNKADNGLLLRADIHTLFDLGLLSIHPDTLAVRVAQRVVDAAYRALDGCKLRTGTVQPSKLALKEHWDRSTP